MFSHGIQLNNTSLVGAVISAAVQLNHGMQGVLVVSSRSGLDPAITNLTVNMKMPGLSGSGYVVAHSSKVITNNCMIGPMHFPAGEYVVRTLGGSSVVGAFIGLYPTP